MTNIVEQCIAWNKARYDQVLDVELALNLLTEETNELFAANDIIDKLDAIGDISFVAIGVLWKSGLSSEMIASLLGLFSQVDGDHPDLSTCTTKQMYGTYGAFMVGLGGAEELDTADKFLAVSAAMLAIWQCIFELKSIGLQQEYFNIVKAICDSNDTKEVKGKTDPGVKANIDKGVYFIPPTLALKRIVQGYELATAIH